MFEPTSTEDTLTSLTSEESESEDDEQIYFELPKVVLVIHEHWFYQGSGEWRGPLEQLSINKYEKRKTQTKKKEEEETNRLKDIAST